MDFIKSLLHKVRNTKMSLRNIFLGASVVVFIISIIVLLSATSSNNYSEIENALLSGKRLEIDLSSGKIHGSALTTNENLQEKTDDEGSHATAAGKAPTRHEDTPHKPTKNEHPQEDTHGKNSEPHAKEPKSTQHEEVSEEITAQNQDKGLPDWIKQDFVGPRMSDLMMELLFSAKKEFVTQAISVRELGDKPVIVIILKGMGLSATTTEEAINLPKEVTMGFSPYSPSLDNWVKKAKKLGHEVVLNIPMETKDYRLNDPGPYAILANSSKEDNITRLKMLLSLVDEQYEAIYSDRSEVFTQNISATEPILKTLRSEGKYFIYGGGYADFSLIQTANNLSYPLLVNDIVLDDDVSTESINAKFKEIERRAKERGYIVVMARPYPITIRMMRIWLDKLDKKGFKVAPVSTLLGKSFID